MKFMTHPVWIEALSSDGAARASIGDAGCDTVFEQFTILVEQA